MKTGGYVGSAYTFCEVIYNTKARTRILIPLSAPYSLIAPLSMQYWHLLLNNKLKKGPMFVIVNPVNMWTVTAQSNWQKKYQWMRVFSVDRWCFQFILAEEYSYYFKPQYLCNLCNDTWIQSHFLECESSHNVNHPVTKLIHHVKIYSFLKYSSILIGLHSKHRYIWCIWV